MKNVYNELYENVDIFSTDIVSESYMILYSSEHNFNKILECLDLYDLQNESLNINPILEFADISGFFNKIKEAIISLFKKFADLIKKFITGIASFFASNKKFLEKYRRELITGFEVLSDNNKKVDGYEYYDDVIDKYASNISQQNIRDEVDLLKKISKLEARNLELDMEDKSRANIVRTILGESKDFETVPEITAYIESKIKSNEEVNLVNYYKNGKEVYEALKIDPGKKIKEEYEYVKKNIIDECLNKIKEAERYMTNNSEKYDSARGTKIFSELTNHIKFIQNICQHTTTVLAKARADELKQTRRFANACVSAYASSDRELVSEVFNIPQMRLI